MSIFRSGRTALPWVIAIAALVLALAGTGYAAKKYLITSTKQISPKVLKQLQGKAGAQGPAGAPGAAGPAGAAGPQGLPGSAKAWGQVVTGINPTWDAMSGYPSIPRRISVGKYCVPAPAGVNPDKTAVFLNTSGTTAGFVTQAGPPSTLCRANEFEIWTWDPTGSLSDGVFFNILVP